MQNLSEELKQKLESLEEGQELTVEDENGTTTYIKPIKVPMCEKHYFEPDGTQDGYQCVKCKNCGTGHILPKDLTIKNGEIVPLGRL